MSSFHQRIFLLRDDLTCVIKHLQISKLISDVVYIDKELLVLQGLSVSNISDHSPLHFARELETLAYDSSTVLQNFLKEECKGTKCNEDYSEIDLKRSFTSNDGFNICSLPESSKFFSDKTCGFINPKLLNRVRSCSDVAGTESRKYENCEILKSNEMLNDHSSCQSCRRHSCPTHFCFRQSTLKPMKFLKRGDFLLDRGSVKDRIVKGIRGLLFYDKDGDLILVSSSKVDEFKEYNDQTWFYPQKMTQYQATVMLNCVNQIGYFLLYQCPASKEVGHSFCMISLTFNKNEVFHYRIDQLLNGDFIVEGDTKSFPSLSELVKYFSANRRHLARRLRKNLLKSLKSNDLPKLAFPHHNVRRKQVISKISLGREGYFDNYIGIINTQETQKIKLKVLIDVSSEALDDFISESILLKSLNHTNVVSFIGVDFAERPYCLVTEYPSYGSLRLCLEDGIIPSSNQKALTNVCLQILKSLQYMESKRFVIHRKLSTSSFCVNERHVIKLGEFDRARTTIDDEFVAEEDEEILIKYAAPEVLTKLVYSTKSDLWALGVTLWEVFHKGAIPYQFVKTKKLILSVVSGQLLLPLADCATLIKDIILKCFNHDSTRRPSVTQLVRILENQVALEAIVEEKSKANRTTRNRTQSFSNFSNFRQGREMLNKFLGKNIFGGSASAFCTPTTSRRKPTTLQGLKFRQLTTSSKEALLRAHNDMPEISCIDQRNESKPPIGIPKESIARSKNVNKS